MIENASDQRMVHLQTFQSGKHSAESQNLLNEVTAAKIVLLNPEKKPDYNAKLRESMRQQAAGEEEDQELSMTESRKRMTVSPDRGAASHACGCIFGRQGRNSSKAGGCISGYAWQCNRGNRRQPR